MGENMSAVQRILYNFGLCFTLFLKEAGGRQCYNYDKDVPIIECEHGCCGPDHEEYCCDITLQIVGSVIGGLLVLSVIAGGVYYCCRKQSKKRQMTGQSAGGGGLLARLGMRFNGGPNNQQAQQMSSQTNTQRVNLPYGHYNPAYVQSVSLRPEHRRLLAGRDVGPAYVIPTAPAPPPYALAMSPPPPYQPSNPEIPPPPVYSPPSTAVQHGPPSHKLDDSTDTMPPASS